MTDTATTIWPADKVERRPIASLLPYANNARTHSPAQVAQLAKLIAAYGWTTPVLVDAKGVLIAGHGRILAAQSLGILDVPTMTATGWTAAQVKAYRLADNALAAQAGWDNVLLLPELAELDLGGFDMELTGFAPDALAGLLGSTEGLTDPDEVPEAPAEPVTVAGDVWIMGRHRVMAGDSTNPEHVATLTAGAMADLCFTSPPYAQQRDYKDGVGDWDVLMQGVFAILPVKHEAQVLVNLGMVHRDGEWMPYWDGWVEWMRTAGWRRFGWYVWDQGAGLPGDWNGRLAPSHEWVFHFNRISERARKTKAKNPENIVSQQHTMRGKDGKTRSFTNPDAGLQPNKIPDSVIRINRQHGKLAGGLDHPAVFPVDLVSEMLTAFSDPDDIVYEPFCGSGTQLISAQKNGRSCLGMELAPAYVDVCVKRWQNFTGQSATLERTGQTFEQTQAAAARQIRTAGVSTNG